MREPIRIETARDVDLACHAVIEASAGTGKTHTIRHLVIELLKKGVHLERILAVTFTEKAAGELRERIRDEIGRQCRSLPPGPEAERLKRAFENFDDAPIFTIHAFCHRILAQYAFENGNPFSYEIEDNAVIYARALKEQMQKRWKDWFGPLLGDVVRVAGFAGNEERWMADVVRIASRYHPGHGDRIDPPAPPDPAAAFAAAIGEIGGELAALAKLAGRIDEGDPAASDLVRSYEGVCPAGYWATRREKFLLPLVRLLGAYNRTGAVDAAAFAALMAAPDKARGFRALIDSRQEKRYAAAMPALAGIVERLETLRPIAKRLTTLLMAVAVEHLIADAETYKREEGLLSYDDMIASVDRALYPGGLLLEELRSRFACALVDEFQDTDRLQWSIFRRIFLEGAGDRRLFVIGDPKQAIYSFRGADFGAYLDATRELETRYGAKRYALATSWRATEPLIDACNKLFGAGGWFGDTGIPYGGVAAPPPERRFTRIYADTTGRAAVTAFSLPEDSTAAVAHRLTGAFIAAEIKRLVARAKPALVIDDGRRGKKPLDYGDICILVRSRKKARPIEAVLASRDYRIPYSFYKKDGLYESDEAAHIRFLLAAASDPADDAAFAKALLTPFFAVPPAEIGRYRALPPNHSVRLLFGRWYGYVKKRLWPAFFRSVLEETGVVCRPGLTERRLANYRHICENLERAAIASALDIVDLIALLDRWRRRDGFGDETFDLHRLETEQPKVRIMTIHAAKGLEFPVVFIADGYGTSSGSRELYYRYHDTTGALVYDLAKSDEGAALRDRENAREDRQIFYVALTRAKHKLYIPDFTGTSRAKGPLVTIVREALRAWNGASEPSTLRFVDLAGTDRATAPAWQPAIDPDLTAGVSDDGRYRPIVPAAGHLLPDLAFSFDERKIELESYSRLKERTKMPGAALPPPDQSWITDYGEGPDRDDAADADPDAAVPQPLAAALRAGPRLAPGTTTGSMLHEVFEEIDFAAAGRAASPAAFVADELVAALIERKLRRFGLIQARAPALPADDERRLIDEAGAIVWKVLRTPLDGMGHPLAELGAAERMTELEFYYPLPRPSASGRAGRDGFLMGYIDLVFRSGGRYYLLDWKSDYLEGGYHQAALLARMTEMGYDLQYKVYSIAVLRWLRATVPGFDYDRHFGGIYYLYLRGMDPARPGEGYLHIRPADAGEIARYGGEIAAVANGGAR